MSEPFHSIQTQTDVFSFADDIGNHIVGVADDGEIAFSQTVTSNFLLFFSALSFSRPSLVAHLDDDDDNEGRSVLFLTISTNMHLFRSIAGWNSRCTYSYWTYR